MRGMKQAGTLAGLRNAALIATAILGRFGATKDNSPEAFRDELEIQGMGPGKRDSRHSVAKPKARKIGVPRLTNWGVWFKGHSTFYTQKLYEQLTTKSSRHGRCDDWIRENRRRRAAGLPQLRVEPFSDEWWRLRNAKFARA